ncbi:uncharacterized protein [Solanum lycopersicum]|uniref:uncharacterized protein n=1 Tax=Solanum lycopersicum TaxID=4081 RepID=UPI003749BA10
MSVLYHPGKDNVVKVALSQVFMGILAHVTDDKKELSKDVHRLAHLGVRLEESSKGGFMIHHNADSSLVVDVKSKQNLDPLLMELKESFLNKNNESFSQGEDGVFRYQGRLCVLDMDGLREEIMDEAHGSRYSIHPVATKIYNDLCDIYWWTGMKLEVSKFESRCPNCKQVKAEHQGTGGLTQDVDIPSLK